MSRTPRMIAVVLVGVLALAGCASVPSTEPAPAAEPGASAGEAVQLVNLWRVTEAAGAGDDAFLRLDGSELIAWTDCGIAMGAWRAVGGLFLADVSSAIGGSECLPSPPGAQEPPDSLRWLYAAQGFRITDGGAELLGADGEVVAVLAVDGAPPANANHTDDYLAAPEVTPEVEARFAEPAPLPAGVEPLEGDALLGRWVPDEPGMRADADPPFLEFAADGVWRASDGCNGTGGRWARGADGLMLATGGFSTQIGCENWNGAYWPSSAARVGLLGGELALYDVDGTMLGAAIRS